LLRFRVIAGFLLITAIPPLFNPNFGVLPWTRSPLLGLQTAKTLSYYSCNYCRSDPTYMTTIPRRYRRTDEQTDDLL